MLLSPQQLWRRAFLVDFMTTSGSHFNLLPLMSALPQGCAGEVLSETRHLAEGWGLGASHNVSRQRGKIQSELYQVWDHGGKYAIAAARVILDGLHK